jgi:bifunctional non-homologous end joining protein LigD
VRDHNEQHRQAAGHTENGHEAFAIRYGRGCVMLRSRAARSVGVIKPCLPSPAERPPSGAGWLHEIKHDGFRIMARRDGAGVRLITRHGNDFTNRFPLATAAISALPGRSFLIDDEAICTDDNGLAVLAVLCVFDLIELDGRDLRRLPIEQRKAKLARLVRGPHPGTVLNEHYDGDGEIVLHLRGDPEA